MNKIVKAVFLFPQHQLIGAPKPLMLLRKTKDGHVFPLESECDGVGTLYLPTEDLRLREEILGFITKELGELAAVCIERRWIQYFKYIRSTDTAVYFYFNVFFTSEWIKRIDRPRKFSEKSEDVLIDQSALLDVWNRRRILRITQRRHPEATTEDAYSTLSDEELDIIRVIFRDFVKEANTQYKVDLLFRTRQANRKPRKKRGWKRPPCRCKPKAPSP